jgi:hypothetical protein
MRFDDRGPWDMPVDGFEVLHMTFGVFLIDIVAYGPEGATSQIRLEGPFELHASSGETHRLDPENDSWERLAALFVLRHGKVRVVRITKTSDLYVEFASGHVLTSSADDGSHEAWEMHAPGGIMVVGRPGEPAIWDRSSQQ